MKQLKQFFALMAIVAVILVVYIFIRRDDNIDPMPVFPPGMDTKEKVEMIQKHWRGLEKLDMDSSGITNLVGKLVREKASHLPSGQQLALAEKLTSWFYYLKTGTYEDFLAFRKPDYWNVSLKGVKWYASALYGNTNAFDHLPESEWTRAAYEFLSTSRYDSIRVGSIHFNVLPNRKTRTEDVLKPLLFYPGATTVHEGNSTNIFGDPIIGYRVKPADVLKKHRGIEWARFRAGYDIVGYKGFICAIELALYWSPDEKRWLSGRCLSSDVWPSSYVPEESGRPPRICF